MPITTSSFLDNLFISFKFKCPNRWCHNVSVDGTTDSGGGATTGGATTGGGGATTGGGGGTDEIYADCGDLATDELKIYKLPFKLEPISIDLLSFTSRHLSQTNLTSAPSLVMARTDNRFFTNLGTNNTLLIAKHVPFGHAVVSLNLPVA